MNSWPPAASWQGLAARAKTLGEIRHFFAKRHVMEVETPILSHGTAPDDAIVPMACGNCFLSTSPETGMKRLLAAGSGPIYQIARAFRHDEAGPLHNPEFTILEWYRPEWSWQALMDETTELVQQILGPKTIRTFTFRQALEEFAGVDPVTAPLEALSLSIPSPPPANLERLELLDLLLVQKVEPAFKSMGGLVFLTHFPVERAAMARIDPGPPPTALRFELYAEGIELVNGYQELTDPVEQKQRLMIANQRLQATKRSPLPIDMNFLAALQAGLPECAGAALGVDRLAMLAMGSENLASVLAFPFDRA